MNKQEIIKELEERKQVCEELIKIVKDKECKAQFYGEKFGLEYAIELLTIDDK